VARDLGSLGIGAPDLEGQQGVVCGGCGVSLGGLAGPCGACVAIDRVANAARQFLRSSYRAGGAAHFYFLPILDAIAALLERFARR